MERFKTIYQNSPLSIQKFMMNVYRRIPFPICYGLAFMKTYHKLMKSQWFTRRQIEELQCKKLRALIKHAYINVPYYHKVMRKRGLNSDDIKKIKDLSKLPILTKDDVRNHFEELMAKNIKKYRPVLSHTSGSTGKPLKFYLCKRNRIMEQTLIWRYNNWTGYNYGDRVAILRGEILRSESGNPLLWKMNATGKILTLSSFDMSSANLKKYVQKIKENKIEVFRGYPSTIYILAKYLKKEDIDYIRPKAIITASETLLPYQRKLIEMQFECKVYDWYGSGERVGHAGQCSQGNYHIFSESGIIEFMKLDEHVGGGELSEMICTGLNNYAMPLIRYKIGDLAKYSNDKCSCGRVLPVITSIEGRLDDILITPDGRYITPSGMTLAFEYIEGIKQSQIVQKSKNEIVVKIVKTEKYTDKDTSFLIVELRKRLGNEIDIKIDFVDEIPRTKSGKIPFVISKVPTKF